MDLYIFRHGETYETKNLLEYEERVYKAEILPEAIPVIKKLAKHLNNIETDVNLSSPFKRCRQTVAIVEEITAKNFDFDNRLSEMILENETMFNFTRRMEEFYKDIESKHSSVAVCTHGYPISALIQLATKGRVSEPELDNYPRPGVLSIVKNGELEILDFN